MPRVQREATVAWEGSVARGGGKISATTSGELRGESMTLAARVGDPSGKTSPEELIAAAHAGCFAMSLSSELTKLERPPERIEVTCTITLDEVGSDHKITRSELRVRGSVPGIGDDEFRAAAERAENGCPVSAVLNAEIVIDARL